MTSQDARDPRAAPLTPAEEAAAMDRYMATFFGLRPDSQDQPTLFGVSPDEPDDTD